MSEINEKLEVSARILWNCFFIGALLLSLWAIIFMFAGEAMTLQCNMFGLTTHECSVLHYGSMGLFKFLILVFFLIPFIAVKVEIGRRRKKQ